MTTMPSDGRPARQGLPTNEMAGASPAITGRRRVRASAPGVIPVEGGAIMVVIEAEAGIGVVDHELVAEIHGVPSRVPRISRLHRGCGGRAEQYEKNELCHDASPRLENVWRHALAEF